MSADHDLVGQRFDRLTVIEKIEVPGKTIKFWLCRCDCGRIVSRSKSALTRSGAHSCGCSGEDEGKCPNRMHGLSSTRLHSIYAGMKARCRYSSQDNSYRYHDRGIRICDEWLNDFRAFYDWAMDSGYRDDLSIDRIDNDGDYCPENCRWITHQEQMNNCSINRHFTYNGETHTVAEWARITGISKNYIYGGLSRGWSFEDIILRKPKSNARGKLYECGGESHTLIEWSRKTGLSSTAILYRLKKGWSVERALTEPIKGKEDVKKARM